jgi:hypothetical protein
VGLKIALPAWLLKASVAKPLGNASFRIYYERIRKAKNRPYRKRTSPKSYDFPCSNTVRSILTSKLAHEHGRVNMGKKRIPTPSPQKKMAMENPAFGSMILPLSLPDLGKSRVHRWKVPGNQAIENPSFSSMIFQQNTRISGIFQPATFSQRVSSWSFPVKPPGCLMWECTSCVVNFLQKTAPEFPEILTAGFSCRGSFPMIIPSFGKCFWDMNGKED